MHRACLRKSRGARRAPGLQPVHRGFNIQQLAELVSDAAAKLGIETTIDNVPNPRVELEDHYYNAKHTKLLDLGLEPHHLGESLLDSLLNIAIEYQDRADSGAVNPSVDWRTGQHSGAAEPSTL